MASELLKRNPHMLADAAEPGSPKVELKANSFGEHHAPFQPSYWNAISMRGHQAGQAFGRGSRMRRDYHTLTCQTVKRLGDTVLPYDVMIALLAI